MNETETLIWVQGDHYKKIIYNTKGVKYVSNLEPKLTLASYGQSDR